MDAPSAAASDDDEYEICNDNGFVYKRRRGLYPDVARPSSQAAGPELEAERLRLRRRRRVLLRLRDKRRRELAAWDALEEKLAQLPAPQPTPPQAPPASPGPAPPAAASSASVSVLDDLLAQAEKTEAILERVSGLCDEYKALCRTHEEDVVDAITALPVWGDPKELMISLQNPDEPGTSDLDFRKDYQDGQNGGLQNQKLDRREGEGKRVIEAGGYDRCQEAAGLSSAAVQRIKENGKTMETCRETPAKVGHDTSILNENRKRKGVTTPSDSKIVNKPKRYQQSTSRNPVSLSPRPTTRRAASKQKKMSNKAPS